MDAYGELPKWWQWLCPRYGNYGGPGWSAGRWNDDPALTDWNVPGIDIQDEMFKVHDWAYQHGFVLDAADWALVQDLKEIVPDTVYGKSYRLLATGVFTVWPVMRSIMRRMAMKRFAIVLAVFLVLCAAVFAAPVSDWHFAADVVPGISPLDFPAPAVVLQNASPDAHWIWSALAGEGLLGAILFGVLALLKKYAKPYLDEWAAQRKLTRLLEAVEAGVGGTMQTYVDSIKAASADGKLTEEEAEIAKGKAKEFIIAFTKAQGIDIIREYGHEVLDWLIEYVLGRMKLDGALTKAVVAPLPDLAP